MGQYWVVVDLDGRTQVHLGKLTESLPCMGTTAKFIDYLRTPANGAGPGSPSKEQVKKWLVLCKEPPYWQVFTHAVTQQAEL
jgi:hypothetical protein